jgi:CBS domain-containing protein
MARRSAGLHVSDFMTADPVTAGPDVTVSEILGLMRTHDIHEVPVVENGNLVGVVTLKSIAKRNSPPPDTKAATLMTSVPKLEPDGEMAEAASVMIASGVRGAPVVQRKKLVGMLTRTDLVRAFLRDATLTAQEVRSVMTPNPQTVREDETVAEARHAMASLDERSVPVIDAKGRLTGVVGLKDLRGLFARNASRGSPGDQRGAKEDVRVEIQGIMRYPPVAVAPETTLREAAELMLEHDISSVIVTEDGKPVGILTKLDLVDLLATRREEDGILIQVTGLDEQEDVYDAVYEAVQRSMKRLAGIVTPRLLNLHIVQHRADGDNSKWSIRARLQTEREMYYQNHHDWELMAALAGVLHGFEVRIKEEKDRRVSGRRRQPPAKRKP